MRTIKFCNDEFSTEPCEGVFWVIGDTLLCFVEPLHTIEKSDVDYLDYNSCWNYIRQLFSNSKFVGKPSDFYPRGKVTVIPTGDLQYSTYTVTIHLDRLLEDEAYLNYKKSLEHTYQINRANNDCELNYVYNCLF
jgi:hypothetical protein